MIPQNVVNVQGVTQVGADFLNTLVQGCTTAAQLRSFVGLSNMSVSLLGINAIGDGFAGNYYWSGSSTAADDNLNVIRPTGLTVGAWLRVTTTAQVLQTATTLAALRALPVPVNPSVIYLEGTLSAGDGGQRMFVWTPASTAADDGINVVNPTGNTGAGRWIAEPDFSAIYSSGLGTPIFVGLNKNPTQVLDILGNVNAPAYVFFSNPNTGSSVEVKYGASNGTDLLDVGMGGFNWAGSNVFSARQAFLHTNALNGMMIGSNTGPLQVTVGNGAVSVDWAIDTSGNMIAGGNQAAGSTHSILKNSASSNALVVRNLSATTGNVLEVDSNTAAGGGFNLITGAVSVLTTPTIVFQVLGNGNVQNTNNSYGAISGLRFKENISKAKSQWQDMKDLAGLVSYFTMKGDDNHRKQIGLIAEDVQKVCPGLVYETNIAPRGEPEEIALAVRYSVILPKLLKAFGEAVERIEMLEKAAAT